MQITDTRAKPAEHAEHASVSIKALHCDDLGQQAIVLMVTWAWFTKTWSNSRALSAERPFHVVQVHVPLNFAEHHAQPAFAILACSVFLASWSAMPATLHIHQAHGV